MNSTTFVKFSLKSSQIVPKNRRIGNTFQGINEADINPIGKPEKRPHRKTRLIPRLNICTKILN